MAKMLFSDLTQEEYRKCSKAEIARTKKDLLTHWQAYSYFSECSNKEEAKDLIDDILASAEMAYAWASRLGTLKED